MKILLLAILLSYLAQCQQIIQQELNQGVFSEFYKENKLVPRFYLCGVDAARKTDKFQPAQVCVRKCKRTGLFRRRKCWNQCHVPAVVLQWTRINGLFFKYCHFQDWSNQFQLSNHGDWPRVGYRMCPQNQFIHGFSIKKTPRDGISGLRFNCKGMYNSNANSHHLVFDGQGSWEQHQVRSTFAISFRAKRHSFYITGLGMEFVQAPLIINFNFNYHLPKDFSVSPQLIDKNSVFNIGQRQSKKIIEFKNQKQFSRIWQNEQGQLNGISNSQSFSQRLLTRNTIQMPYIKFSSEQQQKQQMSVTRYDQVTQNFMFGKIETFKIGRKYTDQITVPPCRKITINQIIYQSQVDIPYTVKIEYTNGIATQIDVINGVYSGTVLGEVQSKIRSEIIC